MSDTTISPNMNMPVPNVGEDTGPDWATNINSCLSIVDSHTHGPDQGVQITPDGININADLPINSQNVTLIRTTRFVPQSAVLTDSADLGCLYEVSADLYYNDGNGNHVRMTQGGSVAGSAGTITGLPSGTASASFAAGAFTFQSATNTPAAMNLGPTKIAQNVASGKGVTISANVAQAADYDIALPVALPPSVQSGVFSDTAGNLSFVPLISAIFTPTLAQVNTGGGTATFTIANNVWYYQRLGSIVMVQGYVEYIITTLTVNSDYYWTATYPIATASGSKVAGFSFEVTGTTSRVLINNSVTGILQSLSTTYTANGAGKRMYFSYSYEIS